MKYNLEQLKAAIIQSKSIRQTLIKLSIAEHGGNYTTIKKLIKKHNIDISHFSGQAWSKDRKIGPKRKLNEYLSNDHSITSHRLKNRLIQENYFEHKCYKCYNTMWNNQQIPLELEHIDGNHDNNELSNLTLLCPNCHAQTPTYRRQKNKK